MRRAIALLVALVAVPDLSPIVIIEAVRFIRAGFHGLVHLRLVHFL